MLDQPHTLWAVFARGRQLAWTVSMGVFLWKCPGVEYVTTQSLYPPPSIMASTFPATWQPQASFIDLVCAGQGWLYHLQDTLENGIPGALVQKLVRISDDRGWYKPCMKPSWGGVMENAGVRLCDAGHHLGQS